MKDVSNQQLGETLSLVPCPPCQIPERDTDGTGKLGFKFIVLLKPALIFLTYEINLIAI